jgi:5-methylcytosine-specific restriction endonuclease McrA
MNYPSLVLNADHRPLSYFPLSTWCWQDAIRAVCLDRVSVLSQYDAVVRSPSVAIRLPSVVALKGYLPAVKTPAFTRFNVFLRDLFRCQYCGKRAAASDLTFDHVTPRSKGGGTNWGNVVTACSACNLRKGSRLPKECGMHPRATPRKPTSIELQERGRGFPPNYLHQSWRDFLYWDTELID